MLAKHIKTKKSLNINVFQITDFRFEKLNLSLIRVVILYIIPYNDHIFKEDIPC